MASTRLSDRKYRKVTNHWGTRGIAIFPQNTSGIHSLNLKKIPSEFHTVFIK